MSVSIIIAADLGCLKAFRFTRDEITETRKIELIQRSDSQEGHERISDRVTDQAGRFPVGNAAAGGQMSHGENHNLEHEMQSRAIRQLAEEIGQCVAGENPKNWFLAANSEIDQKIVDALDESVRQKLSKRIRRNLTKADKMELLELFEGVHS